MLTVGDEVGVEQAALQIVELARGFQPFGGKQFAGEADAVKGVGREGALIAEVVDGQDGGKGAQHGVGGVD